MKIEKRLLDKKKNTSRKPMYITQKKLHDKQIHELAWIIFNMKQTVLNKHFIRKANRSYEAGYFYDEN